MYCPNKSSAEWKQLVETFGEDQAYVEWAQLSMNETQLESIQYARDYYKKTTGEEIDDETISTVHTLVSSGKFAKVVQDATLLNTSDISHYSAFNRIWQLRIPSADKIAALEQVREIYPDADMLDASAILAEDFTGWKATGKSQFFQEAQAEKGSSILETVYNKIVKFIKDVLTIRENSIEGIFKRIDTGVYTDPSYLSNEDTEITLGGFDAAATKDFLDLMNYTFFNMLFEKMPDVRFAGKDFNSFGVNYNDIYNEMRDVLFHEDGIRNYFATEGFEEAIELHKKYLKQFSVKVDAVVNEQTGNDKAEEPDKKTSDYADSDTISSINIASPFIKLFLSNIPDDRLPENERYSSNGTPKMYPLTTIWGKVQEATIDRFDQTEMFEALAEAAKTDASLQTVYDYMQYAPEGIKNLFFKAFSNTKANGKILLYKKDGLPVVIDFNGDKITNGIMAVWEQNLRESDAFDDVTGLNSTKLVKFKNKEQAREFLFSIGIEYTGPMDEMIRLSSRQKYTAKQIADSLWADIMTKGKTAGAGGAKIFSYGDIGQGAYSKVRALANTVKDVIQSGVIENMGVGPDGTTRYDIIKPNPIDFVKAAINNSNSFEELISKLPHLQRGYTIDAQGNYKFYSKTLEAIYEGYTSGNKHEINVETFYGGKPDARSSLGSTYKDMQPDERILLDVTGLLTGKVPVRRPGDKGTQRMIEGLAKVESEGEFYEILWDYFNYEYQMTKQGKPWGLFDGILPKDIERALSVEEEVNLDEFKNIILFKLSEFMDNYTRDLAFTLYDARILSNTYTVVPKRNTTVFRTPERAAKLKPLTDVEKKAYTSAMVSVMGFISNPTLWWKSVTNVGTASKAILSALDAQTVEQAVAIIKPVLLEDLKKVLTMSNASDEQFLNEIISEIESETPRGISFIAYYLDNASKSGEFNLAADLINYEPAFREFKYAETKVNTIYDLSDKFTRSDVDLLGEAKHPAMLSSEAAIELEKSTPGVFKEFISQGRMTSYNAQTLLGDTITPSQLRDFQTAESSAFNMGNKEVPISNTSQSGLIPNSLNQMPVVNFIAMNHLVGAMEQHFLMLGDVSNFKLKDYFKRMSMAVGNGSAAITDSEPMNVSLIEDYKNMNMVSDTYRRHRMQNQGSFTFQVIEDVNESSPEKTNYEKLLERFYEATGKNLDEVRLQIDSILKAYTGVNIADAASVMLLPYYREFRIRHQDWNAEQEQAFQAIDSGTAISKDSKGYFNTIKPKGFGFDSNLETAGIKTSVMPIYKGISKHIPELVDSGIEELIDIMMENSTDMLAMSSAFKVGNAEKASLLTDSALTKNYTPNMMNVKWFQIQVEMPSEVKDEAVEGSQQRIQVFSDLYENGVADDNIAALGDEYTKLYYTLINEEKTNFMAAVGLTEKGGRLFVSRPDRLIELIKEAALSGNIPMNIVESLSINPETGEFNFVLDSIPASKRIMNVIMAKANNNMVRLKKNVAGYVQVPNLFFRVKSDKRLKWLFDENGNLTGAEVYLPYTYLKQLNLTEKQASDISSIEPKLLELLGYRIPTEGPASMSKLIVKGFLPKELGDTVVVPEDTPGVAGSDFDIDKMYIIRPNTTVSGKYVEPFKTIEEGWEYYQARMNKELEEAVSMGLQNAEVASFLNVLTQLRKTGVAEKPLVEALLDAKLESVGLKFITSFIKKHGKLVFTKEEYMNMFKSVEEISSKQQIQNRMLEIELALMVNPKYSGRNFIANSNSILLEQANKYTKEKPLKNKSELFKLTTEWKTGESFLAGKDLVGIIAQHLKFRTIAQMAGLRIKNRIVDDEGNKVPVNLYYPSPVNYQIGSRYAIDGTLISQLFAQHLTAFVDASADPFIFRLNTNEHTINAKLFMMHMGAPVDYMHLFLLQPIVLEYVEGMRKIKSGINQMKSGKERLTEKELKKTLLAKYTKQKESDINFNFAINEAQLLEEKNTPTDNQAAILLQFLEYGRNGRAISNAINAAQPDTKGSGKTLLEALTYESNTKHESTEGIIENFSDIFEKTPLGAFREGAAPFAISAFTPLSILEEPDVRDMIQSLIDKTIARLGYVDQRVLNKFMSTYISTRTAKGLGINKAMYLKLFRPNDDARTKTKKNFNNTIAGKIIKLKKDKLPLANILYPVHITDVLAGNNGVVYGGLKIDNRKIQSAVADLITQQFRELQSENEQLAQDIATAAYAQYGAISHPNSPVNLLPTDLYGTAFTEGYRKGQVSIEDVEHVFYANNWRDYRVVPFKTDKITKVPLPTGGFYYTMTVVDRNATPYIRGEFKTTALVDGQAVEVSETILMKLVHTSGNTAKYIGVNKKGMSNMTEMHTSFTSVFASNNHITADNFKLALESVLGTEVSQETETVTKPLETGLTKKDMIDYVNMLVETPDNIKMELIDEIMAAPNDAKVLAGLESRICKLA